MSFVGKLLSYIGPRAATRIAPTINVLDTLSYFQSVTAPNPGIKATIFDEMGALVGYASYGISPLFDRLYLYDFKIQSAMRRKGYGYQFLSELVSRHGCPIVPVHETGSSYGFWTTARAWMNANGDQILPSISAYELHQEHHRWPHLKAEIDKLNQVLSARIMVEEWSIAVGRGAE